MGTSERPRTVLSSRGPVLPGPPRRPSGAGGERTQKGNCEAGPRGAGEPGDRHVQRVHGGDGVYAGLRRGEETGQPEGAGFWKTQTPRAPHPESRGKILAGGLLPAWAGSTCLLSARTQLLQPWLPLPAPPPLSWDHGGRDLSGRPTPRSALLPSSGSSDSEELTAFTALLGLSLQTWFQKIYPPPNMLLFFTSEVGPEARVCLHVHTHINHRCSQRQRAAHQHLP